MKLFVMIIVLLTTLAPSPMASADNSTPHVAIDADIWLYDDKGEKLFMLPASYYARINNLDDSYYYVTFNGVAGKVKKNEVRAIGYEFQATGTTADLTIGSDYVDFYGLQLKKHADTQADSAITIPNNATFTFIGKYPTDTGETWYYVKYENLLGYVKASRTSAPTLELPLFTPEVSAPVTEDIEEESHITSSVDSTELKIIIIAGLAIPAIGIVVLIFRKRKGG